MSYSSVFLYELVENAALILTIYTFFIIEIIFVIVFWENGCIDTKYIKCFYFQRPDIIHSAILSNYIVTATLLIQLHFKILLSSSYYRLILKCRLRPCHDLLIPTSLTYTLNIAMMYQIQITRPC